jgi:phage/plasmid-like protein (TIGR03299 family)
LAVALRDSAGAVRVPHRSAFDPQVVKQQLGVAIAPWSTFEDYIKELSSCRVAEKTVEDFLINVFSYSVSTDQATPAVNELAIRKVRRLYTGQGRGSELAAAKGTAWGLLNSVTEYVDHHRRAHSRDHRRDAAWFGQGLMLKQRAWNEAMELVT